MNYDVKAAVNINRGKSRLYCPMITQSKHRWLLQGAFVITTAFSFSSDWLSWKVTRVVLINHKAKWNKTKEILIHFWHLNKNHFTSDFLKTYLPSNRYFWYFSSRETFCHFGNLLAFLAKVEVRNFHTTNKWRKSNQELYENRLETRKRPNKEITEAGSVVQEINVKTNAITCEKNWAFSEGWVSRNQTKVVKTANKKGDREIPRGADEIQRKNKHQAVARQISIDQVQVGINFAYHRSKEWCEFSRPITVLSEAKLTKPRTIPDTLLTTTAKITNCLAIYLVRDPVVAGFKTCSSKYCRTKRTRSSRVGRPNSIISSNRSLMAQSNWSGWLLARTNMNLYEKKKTNK